MILMKCTEQDLHTLTKWVGVVGKQEFQQSLVCLPVLLSA